MCKLNLHFENINDAYIIRLGTAEVLNQFVNGKIWFRKLKYYREHYEQNDKSIKTIADQYEGMDMIFHPETCDEITFSHPEINHGNSINIKKSIVGPICSFPNHDHFIACFSYFTGNNVMSKKLIDTHFYEETQWDNILIISDFKQFYENIVSAINPNIVQKGLVNYIKYSDYQDKISIFNKDIEFSWQNEIRIAVDEDYIKSKNIKQIDDYTIEVSFEPVQCFILPRSEINNYEVTKEKNA